MPLRVVVLEDDLTVRSTVRSVLSGDGYVIAFAGTSRDLMRLLRSAWVPCIVLIDPLAWTGPIDVLMERVTELKIPLAVLPIGLSGQRAEFGDRPAKRLIHPESVRSMVRGHCGGAGHEELLQSKVRIRGRS